MRDDDRTGKINRKTICTIQRISVFCTENYDEALGRL